MEPDWEPLGRELANEAVAGGDPTAWFDQLYRAGSGGAVSMPWGPAEPHPLLAQWAAALDGNGRSAMVVGCGLGADAEFAASLGFATSAFDVSPTAIEEARRRWPASPVRYEAADLFELPEHWSQAFDLVVEIMTVQALPLSVREPATRAVSSLVAPGGTLLVIAVVRDDADTDPEGPPWTMTRADVEGFAVDGVQAVHIAQLDGLWRAEFRRG